MKILLAILLLSAPAWPGDSISRDEPEEDEDDLGENTITGARPPVPPPVAGAEQVAAIKVPDARPYAAESYRAAAALNSSVEMVDGCRSAIELIYLRRYKDARRSLEALTTKYPTSGIGPVGFILIYQALMFENYDYRYEKQYRMAYDQARAQLQAGLEQPGNEAFENFLLAGTLGVDAIHAMRKGEFLGALSRAYEATRALDATKKAAPDFIDTRLGDGMYLYWRSAVTLNNKLLPQFEDRRVEGIARMREAEEGGAFVSPGASLALTYTHIEERDLALALDRALHVRLSYPDNVIGNMTLGRIYTSLRRYEQALRLYGEVLVDEPANQRAHYHRGVVLGRLGRYDDAREALDTYVAFREVPKDSRGQALYRIGALYLRQKQTDKAESYFRQAVAASRNESAKRALERIRKAP